MFLMFFILFNLQQILTEDYLWAHQSPHMWWRDRTPLIPKFLESQQNITGYAGDSIFLPCRVHNLGDRAVTWMRKKNLHILTVGANRFSADRRVKALHPQNTDEWTLQIKSVTLRDSGTYECQVNSDPKISKKFYLKIKEISQLDDPEMASKSADEGFNDYYYDGSFSNDVSTDIYSTKIKPSKNKGVDILGAKSRELPEGSYLILVCVVRHGTQMGPIGLFWFKGETRLGTNEAKRPVSIVTKKKGKITVSKLTISSISSDDSGLYTCSPFNFEPSQVAIAVRNGRPEAAVSQMQLNSGSATSSNQITHAILFCSIGAFLFRLFCITPLP